MLDNVPAIEKLRGKNVQHGADMFDTLEWKSEKGGGGGNEKLC